MYLIKIVTLKKIIFFIIYTTIILNFCNILHTKVQLLDQHLFLFFLWEFRQK